MRKVIPRLDQRRESSSRSALSIVVAERLADDLPRAATDVERTAAASAAEPQRLHVEDLPPRSSPLPEQSR